MRKSRKKSLKPPSHRTPAFEEVLSAKCFEGERLANLLEKLGREIETANEQSTDGLPDKIWIKQQLCIGVNDVTRALERMPKVVSRNHTGGSQNICSSLQAPSAQLQVVLVAVDCNPRLLIRHIPSLASSRGVPVIFIKDNRGGSLRLGELVKLKTAMAIGVKARGNRINAGVDEILRDNGLNI